MLITSAEASAPSADQGTPPRSATRAAFRASRFINRDSHVPTLLSMTFLASSGRSSTRRWLTNSLGNAGSPRASRAHRAAGGANHLASTFFASNVNEPSHVYPCFSKTRATARRPPSTRSKDRNARWSQPTKVSSASAFFSEKSPGGFSVSDVPGRSNASTARFTRGFRARYGRTYASIWAVRARRRWRSSGVKSGGASPRISSSGKRVFWRKDPRRCVATPRRSRQPPSYLGVQHESDRHPERE